MLEKLTIRNFQKHKKLEVVFDEHITVICGKTNSGKSALIRSIKYLALNKPNGDFFLRRTTQDTDGSNIVAKITLNVDGRTILRTRGRGDNTYHYREQEYKSFGTEVPEPVASLLKVSETNFQGQHDAPFWFFKSAGEVSKELNSIVNLGLIDSTLFEIASEIRKAKSEVEVSEDRLQQAEQKKDKLSWVQQANEQLCTVESLYTELEEMRLASRQLNDLLSRLRKHSGALKSLPRIVSALETAVAEGESVIRLQQDRQSLGSLLQRITNARNDLWDARKSAIEKEKELNKLTEGKCPICGKELPK